MLPMTQTELVTLASDGLPARLTGQWVHGKKYYFCRYLDIMTHGVGRKWQGKLAYVDLFSGPGCNTVRGSQEEVDGSPVLALNYEFARYIFVDIPEVLSCLKKRLAGHPKFSQIAFIEGDCNEVIEEVRFASPADHLTLAFIDPTGLQIRFRTIQRLVQNRSVDLLMTLQFGMGIRRNLNQYIKAESAKLTAFLGNAEWRKDASEGGSASQVLRRIKSRYLHHLRELGYLPVRDREIDIRNDQNVLLYFIAFASRHPLGGKFWREAIKIEWTGQRQMNYQRQD
jgi:three-Cys-motif partner protein